MMWPLPWQFPIHLTCSIPQRHVVHFLHALRGLIGRAKLDKRPALRLAIRLFERNLGVAHGAKARARVDEFALGGPPAQTADADDAARAFGTRVERRRLKVNRAAAAVRLRHGFAGGGVLLRRCVLVVLLLL